MYCFLLGLFYFLTGSLESFPAPEQQQKANIVSIVMMIVPIVCSIFLVVTRKKNSYPHDVQVPPLPPFDEVVKIMYGKQLDSFADEVVRAIYSKDKTMRFVLLKNGKRLYTYYWKPSTGLKRMNGDMNALRKILCPVCGKLYPGKITVLFSTVKSF